MATVEPEPRRAGAVSDARTPPIFRVVGWNAAKRAPRQRRERWHRLAEDLGGQISFPQRFHVRVTGVLDGVEYEIFDVSQGTAITCKCVHAAPEFHVRRKNLTRSSRDPLPGVTLEFDSAFAIDGTDREAIQKLLTPEIQERLLRFVGRFESEGSMVCDGTYVRLCKGKLRLDDIPDAVQTAIMVARTKRAKLPVARVVK